MQLQFFQIAYTLGQFEFLVSNRKLLHINLCLENIMKFQRYFFRFQFRRIFLKTLLNNQHNYQCSFFDNLYRYL